MDTKEDDLVWESLGLGVTRGGVDAALDLDELEMAAADPAVAAGLRPGADIPALVRSLESQLREVESVSVADFVREGENLAKLHSDMVECDSSLAEMETMLMGFTRRLAELSDDIRRLQHGTSAAAARVTNRSAAEAHLSAFIDEIILPPNVIKLIVENEVGTESYAQQLALLDKKLAFMDLEDTKVSVAHGEIQPQLELLLAKAVQKVKEFLHEKVALLRRPNTNVQIIKENVLLKHKSLFEFLMDHSFAAYIEVRDDYVETMSKLYNFLFQRYIQGLMSLKEETAVRGELLVEQGSSSLKSIFDSLSGPSKGSQSATNVFAIGTRLETLKNIDAPAVILAVAANSDTKLKFEEIQRSIVRLLLETCTSEHIYCAELFGAGQGRMFDVLFSHTVDQIIANLKSHVEQTQDAIGVLLSLKINEVQRDEMKRRKIRDLNNFFTRAEIILKPRFKEVFDENFTSISSASAKSLFSGVKDTSPHVVTRRFAEFAAAITAITRYSSEDDMVKESLKRLRSSYQNLMNSISLNFSGSKNRYIFLINNSDLVLQIFEEIGIDGEDQDFFQDLLSGHILAYAEHELGEHFSDYLGFIRARNPVPERRAASILREFALNWRTGVAHIRENTIRVFPSFKNGQRVLTTVLTQLLQYHKRAETIVDGSFPNLRGEMVTSTAIAYEIKQDSQVF